jgi:hypothetical protein
MFTRGNGTIVPPQAGVGAARLAAEPVIAARIELAHPLSGHAGAIGELTLKVPTFGDFIDCGPVQRHVARHVGTPDFAVEIREDQDAMMRWMIRLTGQPEAILRQLSPRDAFAIRREIARMVAEFEQGNSGSAPTSSSS